MVEFRRGATPIIYVASGSHLYWYSGNGGQPSWDRGEVHIPHPGGNIINLAATAEHLYALCLDGHGLDTSLWRIDDTSNSWERIINNEGGYPLLQSIYADPDTGMLFAGAGKDDNNRASYAILYLDNDNKSLELLKDGTSVLSGAAFLGGTYYLSTRGSGIYTAAGTKDKIDGTAEQVADSSRMFMGMIKLEDDNTIIAIERDGGTLYKVNDSFQRLTYDNGDTMMTDRYATGALALWKSTNESVKMLVAGKQGSLAYTTTSSYTNGYVEFSLKGDGSLNTASYRRDPGNLETVIDQDRYRATLGKHPINHLYQAPLSVDRNRTFFASTQTAGLWSYKDRSDGGWQWNAEN
jgi:hypothetical protein